MAVIDMSFEEMVAMLGIHPPEPIIPERDGAEMGVSPSDEEYRTLAAALYASRPTNVFEFGTCIGGSTRIFALNAPLAHVYSLDLGSLRADDTDEHEAWLQERGLKSAGELVRGFPNVTLLQGDSRTFDYSHLPPMDFVFIDGGHDTETVRSDTENALRMLNPKNPAATIAWHDCANIAAVTQFTDDFAKEKTLFAVRGLYLRFFRRDRQDD